MLDIFLKKISYYFIISNSIKTLKFLDKFWKRVQFISVQHNFDMK